MSDSRQEAIRIRRQVDSRKGRFQVQYGADKRRILVGEAVMFLPGPGASFEVVDRPNILPPFRFVSLNTYDVSDRKWEHRRC
jgi:hypothetical protein